MSHILQVGAGSGGMPVLDLVARDPRVTEITLVEPDVYKDHNVVRHFFPPGDVGLTKASLAQRWLLERRPELAIHCLEVDLCDPAHAAEIDAAVAGCDFGICAADNEAAKHHFNHLLLKHRKPWTLGEVLAGGIGGFVHRFVPGGPCYGCVASFLKRSVTTAEARPADYSQPGGAAAETTIPASKASIAVIAALHAQITLAMLEGGADFDPGFTSLLFTLQKPARIFEEAYRPYKFRVPRAEACLLCHPVEVDDLDRRLDEALDRLVP
jgi:molybdopterin/thiamine biosynthesis adenylyltransferase